MAPKKKSGKKAPQSKTSQSKISNKHINKLAKRGKLNKLANKQKRRDKLALRAKSQSVSQAPRDVIYDPDEVTEPGDEDLKYFGTPGRNFSFADSIRKSLPLSESAKDRKGKKRKQEDDTFTEEDYEKTPRHLSENEKNVKMVLPIKTKAGVVARMVKEEMADEDDEEEEVEEDEGEEMEEEKPLPVLSSVDLYVHRQRKLEERKDQIAMLSNAVISNPDENMKRLRDLVAMLYEPDPDVFVTVRKYAMVSLLEVFKDIIPGYHIRLPTEKERDQRMKKETISLLTHEESLLKAYQEYLQFLEKTAKGPKKDEKVAKMHKKKAKLEIPESAQKSLTQLCVKCMCDLLSTHPHFNYRNNIISVLVPYMNYRIPEIGEIACDCVKKLFKTDKKGDVTLELTRCISRMIKAREFRVQPKVLETFLSLRIKEVSYTDPLADDDKDGKKRPGTERLSRRERKKRKQLVLLERDMAERRSTEDRKKRLRLHTETIQAVFLTYFRILKKAVKSVLLPNVLEGLAKFAHLISVDFFNDLFEVFNKLIASGELTYRESFHCVQTAFTILTGQGSVLNIDPMIFYRHMYSTLFHVHAGSTSADIPIILDCLDAMVSRRKRQVSQQRILAFTKRLSSLVLQQTLEGSLGLLAVIRSFMMTYSYSDILLDNEASGSGVYLPELQDPEHCNAHSATLWELAYLQRHYAPTVRKFAMHLGRGAPASGEGQLPVELKKSPSQVYQKTLAEDIFTNQIPATRKGSKHKHKLNGLLQTDLKTEMMSTLSRIDDSPSMEVT